MISTNTISQTLIQFLGLGTSIQLLGYEAHILKQKQQIANIEHMPTILY